MKKTMLKLVTLLLAAIMLLSAVPAFAVEDGEVRIIVVAPKKLSLKEGERYKLSVSAQDGGSLGGLTWESSDSSVVTVDSNGNLTAHKEGSAKVKVYSKDGSTDSSTCRVTVASAKRSDEKEKEVRIIVMDPKKLTLNERERYKLNVSARDGGSLSGLVWESSDSSVVSVDSNGNLTAHKEGSAKVKVYAADGSTDSSACRVTVEEKKGQSSSSEQDKPVRVIVVSHKKLSLMEEDTYKLTVSAKDGGSLYGLVWESDNPEVVKVDSNGSLTALKKGSARIKVYASDGSTDSSTCRVTVERIKKTPIKAKLEGNIYDANYNRVSSSTEAAVREYCERLGDSRIDKMLRKAVEKVGTPYSTMDCSQLSKYAYSSLGFSLPRVSDDQAEAMIKYKRDSGKPEKGDICFMKFPSVVKCSCGDRCRRYMLVHHAAVYLGQIDGRTYVVDSSSTIGNVIIREFRSNTIAGMPVVFYAGK